MHKTHYINGSSKEKYFYKRYASMLTRIKNLAKKLYFHHKLQKSKNKPQKTWNLLRTFLPSNTSSSTPSSLIVVTLPQSLAFFVGFFAFKIGNPKEKKRKKLRYIACNALVKTLPFLLFSLY